MKEDDDVSAQITISGSGDGVRVLRAREPHVVGRTSGASKLELVIEIDEHLEARERRSFWFGVATVLVVEILVACFLFSGGD